VNNAQVTCNDGVILPAFVYRTSETQEERDTTTKKPGLLFIHGFSGAPEDGECYTKALAVAGFVCMAYSQRGHGRRRKAPGSRLEWWKMWHDFPVVLDAFLALPDVDPNRVFVMGHSLGSNLAMTRGYNDPRVKAVIALSGMPIQAMESRPGGGSRPRIASMFKRFFNGSGLSLEEGLAMISPMSNAPKDDPRAKNRIFLIRCRDDIFPAEPFNNMKAWFGVPDEHCLFLDHGGHKAEGQHAIITAQLIRWLDRVE